MRNDRIVEIKSPLILQPGPAALTDGLDAIVASVVADGKLLIVPADAQLRSSLR